MKGILIRAFESGELIEKIYLGKGNAINQRKVKILSHNESYIRTYCYLKRQIRLFKIENILSVSPYQKEGELA